MNGPRILRGGFLTALAALVTALGIGYAAGGQPAPAVRSRAEFMRQKLTYTQGIVQGLALEDYPLIADGARKLKVLSQASEWEVASIPNVEMYVPYTTEFQRLCDELTQVANLHDIDGATAAYVQLTMNCVNCHKYIRGVNR